MTTPPPIDESGERAYTVGYGRPPVETRFKPGQSGNPKGRPKTPRTIRKKLAELFMRPVTVRDGSLIKRITLIEAVIRKLIEKGIKGDGRAIRETISLAEKLGAFNDVSYMGLTADELRLLSDTGLDDFEKICRRRWKAAGRDEWLSS